MNRPQDNAQLVGIEKVAVIAGQGRLPRHVVDGCLEQGIKCDVIGIKNQFDPELFSNIDKVDIYPIQLTAISKIITKIKALNIKHVVLAGKVNRVAMTKLLLDIKGLKLFSMLLKAGGNINDDSILRTIVLFLESEGFEVIAPEAIARSIVIQPGTLTQSTPDSHSLAEISKGAKILEAIAKFDIGQSLVIQNGLVLGVEAAEGTDALIDRCGLLKQEGEDGCILIKISKPDQERRVDLPCIGPETIERLKQYKFKGIAVQSGSTLILNKEETIKIADAAGLFICTIQAN